MRSIRTSQEDFILTHDRLVRLQGALCARCPANPVREEQIKADRQFERNRACRAFRGAPRGHMTDTMRSIHGSLGRTGTRATRRKAAGVPSSSARAVSQASSVKPCQSVGRSITHSAGRNARSRVQTAAAYREWICISVWMDG